jgi:hypothetical protein
MWPLFWPVVTEKNSYQASLLSTPKPVKQMHNLCASDEARRLKQYRDLAADRTRVSKASVEIMQPGQEREGNHAEQERQHDGEINMTRAQKYHQDDIGQLEKGGALAQEGGRNIYARICEVRHRSSQQQYQVSADHEDGDPRRDQMNHRERNEPGGEEQLISQRV